MIMILWKLKLFLFLDHKFYAISVPPKLLIRLLAVSLFIVREQMWIKKNASSQLGLGQVEKRHTFLPLWASALISCCLQLHFLLLVHATLVTLKKRGCSQKTKPGDRANQLLCCLYNLIIV